MVRMLLVLICVVSFRIEYNEYLLLLVLTCVTFINYMIRAVRVINAFCNFLKIRCLVIPHHPKPVLPVATEGESLLTTSDSNYKTI